MNQIVYRNKCIELSIQSWNKENNSLKKRVLWDEIDQTFLCGECMLVYADSYKEKLVDDEKYISDKEGNRK